MATGRRHYFFVADSIGHEPWTNCQLAVFIRLAAHLHERWARDGLSPEQANECTLAHGDLFRIAADPGARIIDAVDNVLSLAQLVTLHVSINGVAIAVPPLDPCLNVAESKQQRRRVLTETLHIRGRNWFKTLHIRWPKFAEFQYIASRRTPDTRPTDAPSGPGPGPGPKEKSTSYSKRNGDVPPKTKGTRKAPEDLDLTEERLQFATAEGMYVQEAEREFDKMCDHTFTTTRSDWDGVWRNWVREAIDRKKRREGAQRK
jgi:hypothetical protein